MGHDESDVPQQPKKCSQVECDFSFACTLRPFRRLVGPGKNNISPRLWPFLRPVYGSAPRDSRKEAKPMGKGGTQKVGDFEVTMTHAFHSNSIDDNGERIYGGEPAGLVIRMPRRFLPCTMPGTPRCFSDMKIDRRAVQARRGRYCRSATVSRWGPVKQRMQSGFWA